MEGSGRKVKLCLLDELFIPSGNLRNSNMGIWASQAQAEGAGRGSRNLSAWTSGH